MSKFCSSCGNPLVEGTSSCTRCGTRLPQSDSPVAPSRGGSGRRYFKFAGIACAVVAALIVILSIVGILAKSEDEERAQVSDIRVSQEGGALRVSWEAAAGADYYKVYHDDFFDDSCSVSADGQPRFCEEIASRVTEPNYLHEGASNGENYYWVVACSTNGCTDVPDKSKSFVFQIQSPPSQTPPSALAQTCLLYTSDAADE